MFRNMHPKNREFKDIDSHPFLTGQSFDEARELTIYKTHTTHDEKNWEKCPMTICTLFSFY